MYSKIIRAQVHGEALRHPGFEHSDAILLHGFLKVFNKKPKAIVDPWIMDGCHDLQYVIMYASCVSTDLLLVVALILTNFNILLGCNNNV